MKIALQINGKYVAAENGGDDAGEVHANRIAVGPWERWSMVQQGGSTVNLRSDNGHFLSAQLQSPDVPLNATRTAAGPWETFTVVVLEADTSRVHVEGANFVDEAGRRWTWRGCTEFLLFKRSLDGADITPVLLDR